MSHSAARFRYTLAAGATAVVIGVGFTAVGFSRRDGDAATSPSAADVPLAAPASPAVPGGAGGRSLLPTDDGSAAAVPATSAASASPSVSASAAAVPTRTAVTPKPRRTTAAPKRTSTRPGRPSGKPSTAPPAGPPPATGGSIAGQVLAHINTARAAQGLSAYTLDGDLSQASAKHNQLMIGGCGLSHQCANEGGIGDRFSAEGVSWTSAGENIGFGSAGGSDAEIIRAANGLTDSMLAETPPEDGHRKNLLSSGFRHIGLSVVRDGKGVVWMTQDFVN
ncbi:CAP domain-containing protein [Mangrovihabitans endophyticus]|uniref:SCP domain-containing protein n=1 Tax=Mangrovihabitans endophyticus TaxID=1751298 RepID=A0A8J3C8I5_9ACTN|nr:CAP domain-containing protein [Mangrovihabitans endophyticus]GGL19986.1 hypothetical protein GCM10012284_63220 [Mangrovihabitans endophyticus]